MTSRGTLVVTTALLASCAVSDTTPIAEESVELAVLQADRHRSGTRIRARYYKHADLRVFAEFVDSATGQACSFLRDSDEKWRCLPTASAYIRYTDATCTQAVHVWFTNTPPTAPPTTYVLGAVDGKHQVYELGGAPQAMTAPTFVRWGESCLAASPYPNMYAVNVTVTPPATFVRAVEGWDWVGGWRLYAPVLRGVDGSRAPNEEAPGYYDIKFGSYVAQRRRIETGALFDDAILWHLPDEASTAAGLFANATCSAEAVYVPDEVHPYLTTSTRVDDIVVNDACQWEVEFREVSDEPAEAQWVGNPPPSCSTCCQPLSTPVPGVHAVLGPVDLDDYGTGRPARAGAGRLQRVEIWNNDGSRAVAGPSVYTEIYDRELKSPCRVEPFGDGWICYPDYPYEYADLVYTDAACTEKAIAPWYGPAAEECYTGSYHTFLWDPELEKIHKLIGGPSLGTVPTYLLDGGECYEYGYQVAYPVVAESLHDLAALSLGF
jgi:hypothetical protein